jgi:hypothetical protein
MAREGKSGNKAGPSGVETLVARQIEAVVKSRGLTFSMSLTWDCSGDESRRQNHQEALGFRAQAGPEISVCGLPQVWPLLFRFL